MSYCLLPPLNFFQAESQENDVKAIFIKYQTRSKEENQFKQRNTQLLHKKLQPQQESHVVT